MKNQLLWEQLRAPELKKLAEKNAVVMIPMGAVEQHGPHLPVATDTILAQWIAERAAKEMWDKGIPVVIAPAFVIANSMHHMHFSGSLSLTPGTFIQVLKEQCRAIAVQGFRKIAIINGHGGNTAPIDVALIDINQELGFPVYNVPYTAGVDESPFLDKQNYMIHSGEVETSLILAYDESLVDTSYTNLSGNPGGCSDYEDCGALSTFHYMESHTENGIMGESCAASKEKGIALADAYCKRLVEILSDERLWSVPV